MPSCSDSGVDRFTLQRFTLASRIMPFSFQPTTMTARCCQGCWAALWWFFCGPSPWPCPSLRTSAVSWLQTPPIRLPWKPLHPPASVLSFTRRVGIPQLLSYLASSAGRALGVLDNVVWLSVWTFPGEGWPLMKHWLEVAEGMSVEGNHPTAAMLSTSPWCQLSLPWVKLHFTTVQADNLSYSAGFHLFSLWNWFGGKWPM